MAMVVVTQILVAACSPSVLVATIDVSSVVPLVLLSHSVVSPLLVSQFFVL